MIFKRSIFRSIVGGCFLSILLPLTVFSQNTEDTQSTKVFIPITKQEKIKDQLQEWVEIAYAVLFDDDSDYRQSAHKNRTYALIDLRTKFLMTLIRLAELELIDPRETQVMRAGRLEQSRQRSRMRFYNSLQAGVRTFECFIIRDFREYGKDKYIQTYEKIAGCFRDMMEGSQGLKYEMHESVENASEAGIFGDDAAKEIGETLASILKNFDEDMRSTDFLYPKQDTPTPDREEKIHLIEHHMVEATGVLLKSLNDASHRNQVWPLIANKERFDMRIDEFSSFFIDFAQAGGPPYQAPAQTAKTERELTPLEQDVLGLVEIMENIMAGG